MASEAGRTRLLPTAQVARAEAAQIARILIVAVVAWLVCVALGAELAPVFAVVVPLVSLRDDPFSAFNVSIARLVGVVAGLGVGIAIVQVLEPSALAMGLVVGVGLAIGMMLRIGNTLNIQVAVSALLVFSAPDAPGYGWTRLWETGVGTAATLLLAPFLFPGNPLTTARREVEAIADALTTALTEAVAITARPGIQDVVRVRELLAVADRVEAVAGSIRTLGGQIATACRSAPWSVLRRRELRAVGELDATRDLADRLALDLTMFIEEVIAFGGRREFGADAELRSHRLALVSEPLTAAMPAALTGRTYERALGRAEQAIVEFRATEHTHMASVVRRPLHRMVEDVRRYADGAPEDDPPSAGPARPGGGGGGPEAPAGSTPLEGEIGGAS